MAPPNTFVNVADYRDGGYKIVIVASILIAMQLLMLASRLVSRRLNQVELATDDYVLILATALTVGLCAVATTCKYLLRSMPARPELRCRYNMLRSSSPEDYANARRHRWPGTGSPRQYETEFACS